MSQDEKLHKLLSKFVVDEGLNPSLIEISSSPTKILIVIFKQVAPPQEAQNG